MHRRDPAPLPPPPRRPRRRRAHGEPRRRAGGKTYGYATRLDSKRSAQTRVTVLTEGIFVRRIQADPELTGVDAVLFDEVHERHLDSDFGLALALDAQAALRPDLRLLPMSATLDGARYAALLGDAPVIESEGRSYLLELRHIGRAAEARIEDSMAAAIRRALTEEPGGILAFLPGVAEIGRVAERLEPTPPGTILHRLHGQVDPRDQRAAIAPDPEGRRKIVLATSIAESSLTLDGIRVVVDSGLARRPRYDRGAGTTRLVTERASQAAATQRAGRAARQGPGVAYRLWEEAATAGLPRFNPPEILEADLSQLVLDSAIWGVADPRDLHWLDAPTDAAVNEARTRLTTLEALDEDGRPTEHGRALASLPLSPRLAHMLVRASEMGLSDTAAEIAVLLGERGLGGDGTDLERRLSRWRGERGQRAEAARRLAKRWSTLPLSAGERGSQAASTAVATPHPVALCLALAFSERIARRRDASGEHWASVGGRGFRLDPTDPLARQEWLAVGATQGAATNARILAAAAIDLATIEALFAARIETRRTATFDPATGSVQPTRERRLGALRLATGPDSTADPTAIATALLEGVRQHGLALLPWPEDAQALRARAHFASQHGGPPALDDATLLATLDDWLPPLLEKRRRLDAIPPGNLTQALQNLLGWDGTREVDRLAPARLGTPAGSSHGIDYAAEGGPRVECRPQALFGLTEHPTVGGHARVPIVLALTSPAGRPIQTTTDLPGFWAGSWSAVAKEMRGRYPRHPWPDDPAAATATTRTKNADARLASRS